MDCVSFSGNGIVCASGQQTVYLCRAFTELKIEDQWTSDLNAGDQWTFVRCAWHGTDAVLIVASADTGSLWMPAKGIMKHEAHDAPITGLELRPRMSNSVSAQWKNEFSTSSIDGTVKVWRYDEQLNSIISVCKVIIGHASPIMTLSYSPDGFCLAGASYDTIRIWNAEHGHNHMATWKGALEQWNGSNLKDDDNISVGGMSSMNGDGPQGSTDHSLEWDRESKKLAFGLGAQVRNALLELSISCSFTDTI
jgi:WD40 repeat protein